MALDRDEIIVASFAASKKRRIVFFVVASFVVSVCFSEDLTPLLFDSSENVSSFCETEIFNATCPPDHVILIAHARYGRMRLSRCVKLDYGHVGCSADVILAADWRCSGRRKCEIRVPDAEFGRAKPCPDDLKPYLEIGYSCVKVAKPPLTTCPQSGPSRTSSPVTPSGVGVIASVVTDVTGCGRPRAPWRVEVLPGQTIQVGLYDFGLHGGHRLRAPSSSSSSSSLQTGLPGGADCLAYAVLWESLTPGARNVTVCGGRQRHAPVYSSSTHRLDIAIVNSADGGHHHHHHHHPPPHPQFLLHYQAVGCPELPPLVNAWTVRNGDGAMVRCNFTKDVFHLSCSGGRWIGDLANCSGAFSAGANNPDKNATTSTLTIPYGLSFAIVLLIAFTIGIIVLFSGLLFLKRQRHACVGENEASDDVTSHVEKDYVTAAGVHMTTNDVDVESWITGRTLRSSGGRPSGDPPPPPHRRSEAAPPSSSSQQYYGCQTCFETVVNRTGGYRPCACSAADASPERRRRTRTWRPMAEDAVQYFVVAARPPPPPNQAVDAAVVTQPQPLPDSRTGDGPQSLPPSVPQLVAECRPLIRRHLPYPHELPPPSPGDDKYFGCPAPASAPSSSYSSYSYSTDSTTNFRENQELAFVGHSLQLEAAVN